MSRQYHLLVRIDEFLNSSKPSAQHQQLKWQRWRKKSRLVLRSMAGWDLKKKNSRIRLFNLTEEPLFKCKLCDVHVDPKRKSSIQTHLSGAKHLDKLDARTNNNPAVDFNASIYRAAAKHEFTFETVRMLTACNIPLQITSNKFFQSWAKKHLKSNFVLYSSKKAVKICILRQNMCLKKIYLSNSFNFSHQDDRGLRALLWNPCWPSSRSKDCHRLRRIDRRA